MDLKLSYKNYKNLKLIVNQYMYDNSVYLGLWSDTEGPISDITINVDVQKFTGDPMLVAINHDFENDLLDFLQRYELATPTGFFIPSGYVDFTVVQLNPSRILELSNDPTKTEAIFKDLGIMPEEESDVNVD